MLIKVHGEAERSKSQTQLRKDLMSVQPMISPKDGQDSTKDRVSNTKLSLNEELPASQVMETIDMKV